MSFELRLAFKYFRSKKKSLARFTAAVAVIGLAAGVGSLIIAQALARGFSDEMRDKILVNTAHISIFLKDGTEMTNWREIKTDLEKMENVREVLPTAYENALITGENETSYAILKVQSSTFSLQGSDDNLQKESLHGSEIAVGAKLAEKLNLLPGDRAEIVTLEKQTPSHVSVTEIFETGLYDYDSTWIYVSPENFARLHGQNNFTPSNLSISAKNIYKTDETARQLREKLGSEFRILDWQEANRPLFAALSLERKAVLFVISLIVLIAALNITTTLALLVNERRPDIAVLRTCGVQTRSLLKIFLLEGLFLSLIGIFGGVVLGLLGCVAGNYFRLVSLSAEVYSLNYIPFHPEWTNIFLIILLAFLLSLTACFYPALKASRIKPLENLRAQ